MIIIYLEDLLKMRNFDFVLGSDAHDVSRVGEYVSETLEIVKEIFGYVCTFENRNSIFIKFHKI